MSKRKGLNTQSLILEASQELFIEHGYENTSMQAIAGHCKLTKGALYHHFESKEAILEAMCARHYRYVAEAMRAVMQDQNLTIPDKLHGLSRAQRRCELENAGYFSTYVKLLSSSGNEIFKSKAKEYRVRLYKEYIAPLLEEGRQSKIFNFSIPAEILTTFIYQLEETASETVGKAVLAGNEDSQKQSLEIMQAFVYGCARLVGIDTDLAEYIIGVKSGIDNYKNILSGKNK